MTGRLGTLVCLWLMAVPAPGAAQTGLGQLEWLAGCWTGGSHGRRTDEQWMKPAGGTMLGMSRTVADGKTLEFEFLQLRQSGDTITYVAKPSNQPEALFTLVSAGPSSARFENPAHDFPQRIIYSRQPDGSLLARIEGSVNGKARASDFPMKRAICP